MVMATNFQDPRVINGTLENCSLLESSSEYLQKAGFFYKVSWMDKFIRNLIGETLHGFNFIVKKLKHIMTQTH